MAQGQYFDATTVSPDQGGGPQHPIGRFPAKITAGAIEPTNENDGSYLKIEFSTPQGKAYKRFNLWNKSEKAVEIAQKELSALCYATGIHRLDMNNQGREFVGADCQIDVRQQAKNANYTEIGMVLDKNGVDPKALAGGGQPQPTQPAATTFAPQPQQQPQQPAAGPWPTQPQPTQPQPQQPTQAQPWQPSGAQPTQTAPWANR